MKILIGTADKEFGNKIVSELETILFCFETTKLEVDIETNGNNLINRFKKSFSDTTKYDMVFMQSELIDKFTTPHSAGEMEEYERFVHYLLMQGVDHFRNKKICFELREEAFDKYLEQEKQALDNFYNFEIVPKYLFLHDEENLKKQLLNGQIEYQSPKPSGPKFQKAGQKLCH